MRHPKAPREGGLTSSTDATVAVDPLLAALADPTRRRIVERLARGPQTVNRIAAAFTCTRPAISRHLRVLREAGVLREERHGRERVYALVVPALVAVRTWLESLPAPPPGRDARADTQPPRPAAHKAPRTPGARARATPPTATEPAADDGRRPSGQPMDDWAPWARR